MYAPGKTRRYLISALLSAAGAVLLWPAAATVTPAQAAVTLSYSTSSAAQVQASSATDLQQAHQAQVSAATQSQAYANTLVKGAVNALAALKYEQAQQAAAAAKAAAAAAQPPPAPTVSAGSAQAIAQQLLAADGWSGQYSCLNSIIMIESSWNVYAQNASGAYGIPQALPGSKMAVAGANWATSAYTQLNWMINFYIKGSYGTPCAAWSHEQAYGWY